MSLARVKTWVAAEVLTAADLNAEFNNFINNPISLVSPTTGAINFNQLAHTNFRAENVASAPTASTANVGRLVFNTASSTLQVDMGTVILDVGPSFSGSRVVGLEARYNTAGSTSGGVVQFQADEFYLQSTRNTNTIRVVSTSLKTINTSSAGPGPGGRDKAADFSTSTVLHYYAIATGAGSTCVGIVSSSRPLAGGPVMPTSYSHWAYLGSVVCSSNAIPSGRQTGALFTYQPSTAQVGGVPIGCVALSSGNSTTVAAVPYDSLVPRGSGGSDEAPVTQVALDCRLLVTTTGFKSVTAAVASHTFVATTNHPQIIETWGSTSTADRRQTQVTLLIPGSSQANYVINTTAETTETRGLTVAVTGYRVSNGDA